MDSEPVRPRPAAPRCPGRNREQVARAGGTPAGVLRQEAVVGLVRLALDRLLERHDDRRRPAVVLAVLAEAHPPVVGQGGRRLLRRRERRAMPGEHILGDLLEPDASDRRRRAVEAGRDHLVAQAEDLEDLSAAVRGQGGDAHLREDLEQALLRRRAEPARRFRRRGPRLGGLLPTALTLLLGEGVPHRREREPRMHRLGAVADQRREVMDVERVTCLRHEPDPGAEPGVHQVLPHRADREEHGDGRVPLVRGPVADDDDACTPSRRPLGRPAERGERGPQPFDPLAHVPHRVEGDRGETRHVAQRGHLVVQQDRVLEAEHPGVGGPLQQRGAAAAQVHPEGHDHGLPQRVDRRVGHLGEALAEVGVDALGHRREGRDRCVVAHAPDRDRRRSRPSAPARCGGLPRRSRRRAPVAPARRPRARAAPARGRAPGSPCSGRPSGRRGAARRSRAWRRGSGSPRAGAVSTTSTSPGPTLPHSTTSRGSRSTTPDLGGGNDQPVAPHLVAAGPEAVPIHHGARRARRR